MTTDPHRRMRRIRWTSYTLVVVGYVLAFFHRMAPAAIATDLQQSFLASGAARAHWQLRIFTLTP